MLFSPLTRSFSLAHLKSPLPGTEWLQLRRDRLQLRGLRLLWREGGLQRLPEQPVQLQQRLQVRRQLQVRPSLREHNRRSCSKDCALLPYLSQLLLTLCCAARCAQCPGTGTKTA